MSSTSMRAATTQPMAGVEMMFSCWAAHYTSQDRLIGGGGRDTLVLSGDYSSLTVLAATTLVSVEYLRLGGGHDYSFRTNNANVAAGRTLVVNGGALGGG